MMGGLWMVASKSQSKVLLLTIVLVLIIGLLCGCRPHTATPDGTVASNPSAVASQDTAAPANELTFAYTANDSLNPYLAQTKTNQELTGLLFDGLVVFGNDFEPEYRLAKTIEMKGTSVTITLKDARFSDGSKVTARDVLTSLEAAKEAEMLSYKQDFSVVQDMHLTDGGALVLTLSHEDPYFVNFLDFPIYKAGSDDHQNDDNKDLPPIGSGRYVFHEQAGSYWLTANPDWVGGKVNIAKITLLNLPDDDAIDHACQVGTVDWCYSDLADNTFPNMNGISKTIGLANLVYLGANMDSGFMSHRDLRMGVSAAIDRADIVTTAYFEMATSAAGPYPAGFEAAGGLQSILPQADVTAAEEYFVKAGFKKVNKDGYRTNGTNRLEIRLVYNKENSARVSVARLIANRLKTVGCKVNLTGLKFKEYQSAIQYGQYDLYLGEMLIPDNFDLYPLLTAGGLLKPDVSEKEEEKEETSSDTSSQSGADTPLPSPEGEQELLTAARAAYRYHNGQGSLTEMLSCFNQQLPIIPLCHRKGMLIYANFVAGNPEPLPGDPFNGLENCTVQ